MLKAQHIVLVCYINFEVYRIAAKRVLQLVPTHVLSITSRANANSLLALWPIRAPCPICANQDA